MSDLERTRPRAPGEVAGAGGSPATSRRRRAAGELLVLAGLVLATAQVIQPRGGDEVFAVSLAEARGAWTGWGLLIMGSSLLQLPAVVSLRSSVTSGRGARLTSLGGGLTFVSLVGLFAFGETHASLAALAGRAPVSSDVLEAFDRLDAAASLGVTAVLGLLGFHLGWPLLLAGLARGGRLSPPIAVVSAAAVFLSLFGAVLGRVGEPALFVLAALSLAVVGLTMRGSAAAPRGDVDPGDTNPVTR